MSPRILLIALVAACHSHAPPPPPPPPRVVVIRESPPVRRNLSSPLTAAARDSLLREAQGHRAAWRARGITAYRMRVAVGCFCPWSSTPAVLEVRGGKAVALFDLAGKPFGAVREPWSSHTVDAMFDMIERAGRDYDVIEATYDSTFDYPTAISGDAHARLPDDWFWVTASHLTPLRP